jgi:hypothetical protein
VKLLNLAQSAQQLHLQQLVHQNHLAVVHVHHAHLVVKLQLQLLNLVPQKLLLHQKHQQLQQFQQLQQKEARLKNVNSTQS